MANASATFTEAEVLAWPIDAEQQIQIVRLLHRVVRRIMLAEGISFTDITNVQSQDPLSVTATVIDCSDVTAAEAAMTEIIAIDSSHPLWEAGVTQSLDAVVWHYVDYQQEMQADFDAAIVEEGKVDALLKALPKWTADEASSAIDSQFADHSATQRTLLKALWSVGRKARLY